MGAALYWQLKDPKDHSILNSFSKICVEEGVVGSEQNDKGVEPVHDVKVAAVFGQSLHG